MTTFEIIKERVTVPQAAAYYGISSQNGMCCCFEHTRLHTTFLILHTEVILWLLSLTEKTNTAFPRNSLTLLQ